ncbi:MAG: hypothetical protein LBC28_03070, partial [Oscillospiraceae bacterium]|nr:hypothetical protein [Oscillospiraceae bacterium]
PGEYSFDLAALQAERPEISSKTALRDWLDNTPFTRLRLRCRHTPPWIAGSGKYDIYETPDGESIIAEVIPK